MRGGCQPPPPLWSFILDSGVARPPPPSNGYHINSWGGGGRTTPTPGSSTQGLGGGRATINARPRRRGADHQRKAWAAGAGGGALLGAKPKGRGGGSPSGMEPEVFKLGRCGLNR